MSTGVEQAERQPSSRHRRARWIAVAVGTAVAALSVVLALNVGTDVTASQRSSPLLGRVAPSFHLPALGGGRIGSGDVAGKSMIVNFWNTWCVPCRQELPALKVFYASHLNDPDFVMLGLVRDDSSKSVQSYVPEESIGWRIAFDPAGKAALDFGTRGQPETFAISASGRIVGFQWGPSTVRDLEAMLTTARSS